jgi:hypothetical protein
MKTFFKWFGIILLILVVIGVVGFQFMKYQTKQHSPEQTVSYNQGDYEIEVIYSRPFKKDREIFGGLVPYGEVWRTGANEATTFKTNKDLNVKGQQLPAGEYTLWTIPGKKNWEVIFNSKDYGWGVDWNQNASRKADYDVVNVTVPAEKNFKVREQFTIEIEGMPPVLKMAWDDWSLRVPIDANEEAL